MKHEHLTTLRTAAATYAADLESGLADGTYDDRADLDAVKAALDATAPISDYLTAEEATAGLYALAERYGVTMKTDFVPAPAPPNLYEEFPVCRWKVRLFAPIEHAEGLFAMGDRSPLVAAFNYGRSANAGSLIEERLEPDIWRRVARIQARSGLRAVMANGQPVESSESLVVTLAEVLQTLDDTAVALRCADFAVWCEEYDRDTDSITALADYRRDVALALRFKAALGEAFLDSVYALAAQI